MSVLIHKDDILINKEYVTPQDLNNRPLICSQQSIGRNIIINWFNKKADELDVVATYNLLYNASILVDQGLGLAIGLDKIINTTDNTNLVFKPLYPKLIFHLDISRKKNQVFPKCAEIFLKMLKETL